MSFSSGQGHGGIFTEINITPLTDIFLVLLIIMMVIAPSFQNSRNDVKMPALQSGEALDSDKVIVEMLKNGTIFLNSKQTPAGSLEAELRHARSETNLDTVVLRADKDAKSSSVMKVYESASQAGFAKLTVAGESLNQARAAELESKTDAPVDGDMPGQASRVETPQ